MIKKIEPKNVDQEWNHSNLHERMKWILIIKDELTTMIQKNVLSPVKKEEEYLVTRPLVMNWVF